MAALSGAFGVLAGLLAAVGLYGVLSYTVMRRSNEIGIRLAMGASRAAVLRMVIAESGWLVGTGLVIGLGVGPRRRPCCSSPVVWTAAGRPVHDSGRHASAGGDWIAGQLRAGSPRLARRSDERIKTGIEPQGSSSTAWNRSRTMPLEHLELLEPWNG